MSRKRINKEPLTNAEKQRRYREKQKAVIKSLQVTAGKIPAITTEPTAQAPDIAALREQIITELKKTWEPELKAERIAAERKKGRELAKKADQTYTQGRTAGICQAAAFFIGKDRADIAQSLLTHFMIDREQATAALEADKRTKSMTLESLDKSGAWKAPPPIIK